MRFEDLLRDTAAAARKEALAEGMAIGMAQGRAEGRAAVKEKDILRAFAVLEERGMDSEAIFSMLSEIFAENPDQIIRIISSKSSAQKRNE